MKSTLSQKNRWIFFVVTFLVIISHCTSAFARRRVIVPDVVGKSEEEAKTVLSLENLEVFVEERETEQSEYFGKVIETEPPAGRRVRERTRVKIILGLRFLRKIPNVAGMEASNAKKNLESQGFLVEEIVEESLDASLDGKVLRTKPSAGERAGSGQVVTIYVGKIKRANVSDIVGMRSKDAKKTLETMGFRVIEQYEETGDRKKVDRVLRTEPAPGSAVPHGASILVVIAQPKKIVIPFHVTFSDQAFYVGSDQSEVKKFSELTYRGIEMEVSKGSTEPIRVGVGASWRIEGGNLEEVSLSYDGGATWESLSVAKDSIRVEKQIYPPAGIQQFVFRVKGYDTDESGNPIGEAKFITDTLSGRINVWERVPIVITPFNVIYSNQRLAFGKRTIKFSDILYSKQPIYSDEPVRIHVATDWRTIGDTNAFHWFSKNGGERKEVLQHPGVSGGDFEFVASPGESFDLVWGADGYDVDNSGRRVGNDKTIVDSLHVKVSVIEPTFDAVFGDNTIRIYFSSGGVDVPYIEWKKFSEIPSSGLEVIVPTDLDWRKEQLWVLADIHANWKTKGGMPSSIDLSLDGGSNWMTNYHLNWDVTKKSHTFTRETLKGDVFEDPPFNQQEILLRITGYDGGERETGVKYITDTRRVKIGIKKAPTPPEKIFEGAASVLFGMIRHYEEKDFQKFMSRISENFPKRGELEEFVRRDFRDYSQIRIELSAGLAKDVPDGRSVQADWEMQVIPANRGKQIRVRGERLEFVFVQEGGILKLRRMRGGTPLFGGRSSDVAASSGAPGNIAEVLRKIENEGTIAAQQAAASLLGNILQTGIEEAPVTFEIMEGFAKYTNGALENVDFNAVQTARPIKAQARVRILDNPKNFDFSNLKLEVTDSLTVATVSVTGDVQANKEITFKVDTDIIFSPLFSGRTGTLTFVLDPEDKFVQIERGKKTVRVAYTLL